MSYAELADQPKFAELADELLAFLDGAELIIHNAPFDLAFLDAELDRCSRPRLSGRNPILDTLDLARRRHPGQRNSLDALCTRYGVDGAHRTVHGARLDAQLLTEVYLAMTGGQTSMELTPATVRARQVRQEEQPSLRVIRATPDELRRHEARLDGLDRAVAGSCVWRQVEAGVRK